MQDMLVNLLQIPSREITNSLIAKIAREEGINIRRAMVPDMVGILEFVEKYSGRHNLGECTV